MILCCKSLNCIFVPINYESTSFCGITELSYSCEDYLQIYENNYCYEVINCGKCNVSIQKRLSVMELESQQHECFRYECRNDSGIINITLENCNNSDNSSSNSSSNSSIDSSIDSSSGSDNNNYRWRVEITLIDNNITQLTAEDINNIIGDVSDIDRTKINISTEKNNEGYIIKIIVHVNDKHIADIIFETVNQCALSQSSISSIDNDNT